MLTFTAPGNDWRCGTAAKYDLFTSSKPITQATLAQATPIPVTTAPAPAGTLQTITIPASANKGYLALRAEDAAGNIGPVQVRGATSDTTAHAPQMRPGSAAATAVGPGLALLVVAVQRRARRRRRLL
ncbi:MAG: hypothetical protein JOZ46_02995 [Candidatus Dormibacteraeota bacterium]|nr:hypothetical protein [Candidatus Dormibacteraeota bacterium]